jgi:4-hydroxybenzoate polyprenyltransferase
MISIFVHTVTFLLVLTAGVYGQSGILFWAGTIVFTFLLIYQHSIVHPDDLSRVTLAFGTTNGMASLIFAIFVIADLILRYR